MSIFTNQNLFQVPSPVIRVKLTFHSDEPISLPGDTWHLLEFSKTPIVSDIVEQIKFRFELSKKHFVTLGLKGAIILKSEKSQIFRDEDTITVNLIPHTRPSTDHNAFKKAKLNQPIKQDFAKRKTAVTVPPPKLIEPIKKKPISLSSTTSESSDQSDKNETGNKEKTESKNSVLFIPRQVPGTKPSAIHSTPDQHTPESTNQKQEKEVSSSSSSSSSSEPDASVYLQSVLRGDKHVRFSKQSKQPITLRPRGRGRGFGRVPPELANRLGPPPPVGRGRLVSARSDKLRTKNQIFVNKQQQQQQQQQQQPPQQQQQGQPQQQQQHEQLQPSAVKSEILEQTPDNFSHLPSVTCDLPPKIGALIVFKILEMNSEYSPVQSDYRKARVLSYDPNNEMLTLEYLSDTIQNIHQTKTGISEGKFAMEETESIVQSNESLNLSQLIDPRVFN